MHLAGVSFTIGVIQDSPETALNFSGGCTVCRRGGMQSHKKSGKAVPAVSTEGQGHFRIACNVGTEKLKEAFDRTEGLRFS